jgi:hypothetical protein
MLEGESAVNFYYLALDQPHYSVTLSNVPAASERLVSECFVGPHHDELVRVQAVGRATTAFITTLFQTSPS